MQYQKEGVRKAILDAAVAEFTEQGYEKASMRTICRNAGVSVGNLYRYFPGREALFESIVGDLYRKTTRLIREQEYAGTGGYDLPEIANDVANRLLRDYSADVKKFVILFDKSKGSAFEGVRELFYRFLRERLISEVAGRDADERAEFLCGVIANGLLEGIYSVIRLGGSPDESRALLERLLIFYFTDIRERLFPDGQKALSSLRRFSGEGESSPLQTAEDMIS